ncbi:hypothetical protein EMIT0324P_170062 [Pseudomonas chlororaphis]
MMKNANIRRRRWIFCRDVSISIINFNLFTLNRRRFDAFYELHPRHLSQFFILEQE